MEKIIFTTNNSIILANAVISKNGFRLGNCDIKRFADQEISVQILEDVVGKNVFVLGSGFPPADNLMELLILIHTLKSNGAGKITAIVPYFAYAKADKIKPKGSSMAAQLVTQIIETSGADEIISINLHSSKAESFFTKPLLHLSAIPILAEYFKRLELKNISIVSPDLGGVERAKDFAANLGVSDIIAIEKYRPAFDKVEIRKVSGDVKGKNIIIVDDMIQSGGTIIEAAKELKKQGAKDIFVAVTHLVFTGNSVRLLKKSRFIKKVIITDTIPSPKKLPRKFEVLSVSELISNALNTIE